MDPKDFLPPESSITEIADLQPGDHLCCIYETEKEHRNVLTSYIRRGLEKDQKVIYIVDANTAEEILSYLRQIDYPPEPYLESGQLVLLTQDQSYVRGGTFDPDAMIDLLEEETEKALAKGYSALRVTGEMTWALRGHPGSDRLMEYENKLNQFFPNHQALGLCQYDRTRFDAELLLGVLRTHPIAVIGEETYENFHYIPPGELLGEKPREAEFRSWEEGLKQSKRKKLHAEHLNSLLRSIRNVNQLLVRENDVDTLLEKTCEVLVETRGYRHVWMALFDESDQLTATAESGPGGIFKPGLERLKEGDIPVKIREALNSEDPIAMKNPASECLDSPIAENHERRNSITVRLAHTDDVYGVLSASAPADFADDEEEKHLIKEVAGDIALKLHNIETEKELQKSEERYQKYFEKTGDAIFIIKMGGENHGNILDVNSAAEEQTGYSREDLLNMNMVEDIALEMEEKDQEEVKRKLSRGKTTRFTQKKREKNGTEYWTEVVVTPLEHEGRQANLSINRDITERKRAKQALKESEQKYRSLFDSIRDAILVADTDRNIINCNPAFTELFGYQLDEIEGKKTKYIYQDEEEYEEVGEEIEKSVEDPNFFYTIHYEKKDGEVFPGETNVFYLRDDEGEIVGFIGLIRDVTERIARKEALKRSEKRYRTVFENTGTAMIIIEEDTTITLANEEVEKLSGYSKSAIEGNMSWTDLVAKAGDLEKMKEYHRARRADPASVPNQYEFTLLDKEGREKEVMISIDVIPGSKKSVASLIDITEQKNAQTKLRQSFIELAETTSRVLGVRDPYTQKHELRVGELARKVGKRMGLAENELLGLYIGGVLHDIGKIAIPETILTKPGELKDVEWDMIKSHPKVGYDQILKDTDFPWPVAEMTLHHHERLDGSGYPDGLEGDQLTTEVRILGAVDVLEAMSTRRPYRAARTKEETLEEIKDGKGEKYDPEVVEILVEMIHEGEIEFG